MNKGKSKYIGRYLREVVTARWRGVLYSPHVLSFGKVGDNYLISQQVSKGFYVLVTEC